MSTSNLMVRYIAFNDTTVSNNPNIRIADISYNLLGHAASKPKTQDISIGPNETLSIFNGLRSTSIDNTTAFDLTRPNVNENIYRLTKTAGTSPSFRANRSLSIDNTTFLAVTVNASLMTLSNSSGTAMNTSAVVIGDQLKIGANSGFSLSNQGRFTIIAKTSNSITVQNSNAAAETALILSTADFLVYSSGVSSNSVQIGDKLAISSGFSQASFGTYQVTEVTPDWVEFLAGASSGLPLESNILVGTSGLSFYLTGKQFLMIAAQQKCSIRCNGDTSDNIVIEPREINNPESPGIMLKHGIVYSLEIKNLSLENLNLVVVTAE
jgi:hypothetical protein